MPLTVNWQGNANCAFKLTLLVISYKYGGKGGLKWHQEFLLNINWRKNLSWTVTLKPYLKVWSYLRKIPGNSFLCLHMTSKSISIYNFQDYEIFCIKYFLFRCNLIENENKIKIQCIIFRNQYENSSLYEIWNCMHLVMKLLKLRLRKLVYFLLWWYYQPDA